MNSEQGSENAERPGESLETFLVIRHGDRTGPDGKPGLSLSDFGKEMNTRQAGALTRMFGFEKQFDRVEILGSTVGPLEPHGARENAQQLGRSAITAATFGEVIQRKQVGEVSVKTTDLFHYDTTPTAPPKSYDHTAVYNAKFKEEREKYLRGIGVNLYETGGIVRNAGSAIPYYALLEPQKRRVEALRDRTLPSNGRTLESLTSDERQKEEEWILGRVNDFAAEMAQHAAAQAMLDAIHGDDPKGRAYGREYAGGLAYVLMCALEARQKGARGRNLSILGIHGPLLEALLAFTLRRDAKGKSIRGLRDLDEIKGSQHTSESFRIDLIRFAGDFQYVLSANDPSKFETKDLLIDMGEIRQLANDFKVLHVEELKPHLGGGGDKYPKAAVDAVLKKYV